MTAWILFVFGTLLLLAVIGVGATLVRQAHARSGYLMIAAGVLELLTRCCMRGVHAGFSDAYEYMLVFQGLALVGTLVHVVFVALLIGSLIGLANELTKRKSEAAPPAGPPAGPPGAL